MITFELFEGLLCLSTDFIWITAFVMLIEQSSILSACSVWHLVQSQVHITLIISLLILLMLIYVLEIISKYLNTIDTSHILLYLGLLGLLLYIFLINLLIIEVSLTVEYRKTWKGWSGSVNCTISTVFFLNKCK